MERDPRNNSIFKRPKLYWLGVVFVLFLSGLNVFTFLGSLPVTDFDEARHGISAYEMISRGNPMLTTYLDNPDYWNLKPPLGIWLIVVAYKLFGYSVFSLRFFSALFACLTVLLTMVLAKRHFGSLVSLTSGVMLATTYGFVWGEWLHAARTGDMDSALAFLTVLSLLLLDRSEERPFAYYLSAFTASLAFLLKSFGSLPIVIIMVLFLLLTKRKTLMLHPAGQIGFVFAYTGPIIVWAFLRYSVDGLTFLKGMVFYDVLNRSLTAMEGNAGGPFYYMGILWRGLMPWSVLIPVFAASFLFMALKPVRTTEAGTSGGPDAGRHSRQSRLFFYSLWIAVPLVLFSLAKTKVPWYINMIYPPVAIVLAWCVVRFFNLSPLTDRRSIIIYRFMWGIALLALFLGSEERIVKRIWEHVRSVNQAQAVLYSLPRECYEPGATLHMVGLSDQSVVFIAKALKHLRLNSFSEDEFDSLAVRHANNLVAIEMKTRELIASGTDHFLKKARTGDLIMLENTDENRLLLKSKRLLLLNSNNRWLIAQKK